MTNDNQDALRCAEYLDGLADEIDHTHFTDDVRGSAAHLRRLVRENEALRESVKKANEQAEHFERECFLRWDQIDWSSRTITVVQKGRRQHTIPLTNEMVAIITPQRGRHPVWVFTYLCERTSKKAGRIRGERYPVTYEGMKTRWRRKRSKAGADDMRFHDNRHTAATRLLRRTGNLKAAQRLLGHADISTTAKFYAHVSIDDLRDLLDAQPRKRKNAR